MAYSLAVCTIGLQTKHVIQARGRRRKRLKVRFQFCRNPTFSG